MATASASARDRQPIAVIRDTTIVPDPSMELLARLDAALGVRRQLAAIAAVLPEGTRTSYEALLYIPGSADLEHLVRLWGTKWRLRAHDETIDGERRYRLYDDFGEVLALVWPKPEVVAEVTALAVRDALAKPHWTDAETSALGVDGREVVTTEADRG